MNSYLICRCSLFAGLEPTHVNHLTVMTLERDGLAHLGDCVTPPVLPLPVAATEVIEVFQRQNAALRRLVGLTEVQLETLAKFADAVAGSFTGISEEDLVS